MLRDYLTSYVRHNRASVTSLAAISFVASALLGLVVGVAHMLVTDYLARMVKPHDAVLLVAQGEQCYIQHQAASPYGAPWFTIGRLSQKSKLRAQMLTHHVNYLSGLFINNIVAWTYEDTVQSDIKRLQEALAEQGQLDLEEAGPDLSDPQVRASLAHSLNLTPYASYWAPETRARGYCYLVTLAGRGTPH